MFEKITLKEIVDVQNKWVERQTIHSKILVAMIKRASQDGWARISYKEFERFTGMPPKSVVRILKRLEEMGVIEKGPEKGKRGAANQYRVV